MRKLWLATLGAFLAASAAAASAGTPVPPDEVVKETTSRLQKEINAREKEFRANPEKLYQFVDDVIVPKFDTRFITQLILARHWRSASPEQRARFEVAFKNMLVHSYANALVEYHDSVKAEWQPLRMAPDSKDVTVQSKLLRNDGRPLPIGFAMRLRDGQWKVYDIIVENLSLITSFRSQVNSEIKREGLEALIAKLEKGQRLAAEERAGS